jgi:TolA-binding protein
MNNTVRKANSGPSLSAMRLSLRVLLFLTSLAATAIGCAWVGTSHSVRFNDYQTEREMGRLPPLPTMANGMNELRLQWDLGDDPDADNYYTAREDPSKTIDGLWDRAEAAEKDGNLRLDRELLREYLKQTQIARDPWFSSAGHGDRNSAIDRLDALNALDHGSSTAHLKAYLDARRLHDANKPDATEVERALEMVGSDFNLRDNVAYLRGAKLYRQEDFAPAAAAFGALARQYPHSEKREAALFMSAVATMKTSVSYIPASGNADYDYGNPAELSTDQAWQDAFTAFQRVVVEYPRGRYLNDARSWQAYLLLRRRDRAGALVQYYRLLADSKDENARIEAAFSLQMVRSPATDDEMGRVEKQLEKEPQAALAYAYHNIYNYSIDPGESYPPYENDRIRGDNAPIDYDAERRIREEREKDWADQRADTGRKELLRTLEFSKRLIQSYPDISIGGAFALRAAQASEELEDNAAAAQFARRALQSRLNADERAQALWTLGIAEHRLHHFDAARKNFTQLLHDYPKTGLTEGARRTLAMIAEDAGDIDGALEQYIALDYNIDVSYFVDILMTPEPLAGFIQRHPDSPKRNEFTYALGVRYLRANRWNEARQTLALVHTAVNANYNYYCSICDCRGNITTNCTDPKDPVYDEREDLIITPNLVMLDIQTANDLEARERAADQAVGDEAKAEALYQLASYQYEASSLLFYNPLASPGYWNLGELAGKGRYRVPNESQILWKATQEHERLARALNIYLQVVNRFPHTRAARDALYTAAVCHERLSNYNPYWREIYQNGLHAGERMVTYQDVKTAYPNYQLPRGSYGWQPSTRTVNNGPGWAAPPKPTPRLTKTAQVRSFINNLGDRWSSFWNQKGRRWLTELVMVLGVLFIGRIARRNQRRLRTRIVRHRRYQSRQTVIYPWLEMFWIDPVVPSRREQLRKLLGDKRQEFLELARDRRSRPVLIRSLVSHSVLTVLTLSLIWTVAFG